MLLSKILHRLEVAQHDIDIDPSVEKNRNLDNDNLRPLRIKDRTWGFWTYAMFWFSEASSVSDWFAASAAVTAGLSPMEALFTMFAGRCLAAILIALNGRGGAIYHIPFPSLVRSSFGVYGSWWPVLSRAVLSIVYQGINLVQGGTCVYVLLHSVFPSMAKLPNTMPKGAGITTSGLIGVFILWIPLLAIVCIPAPKLKVMVHLKLVAFAAAAISMLVWCSSLAGGIESILRQSGTATGSTRLWLLIRFFFIGLSSCATFTTDAADFQRYAKQPNDVLVGQLLGGPAANLLVHLVGVIVAASSKLIFDELIWNPILLLDRIQTDHYSAANRAGCFFVSLLFCYSSLVTMVLGNILPAANDLTGLAPRYLDYRRAAYVVAIVAIAINPWWILGSASIFTAYLSSFGIFYASIIGVMITDYYVIKRGYVDIPSLYVSLGSKPYYFWNGINLRAYASYICGIVPSLPGFSGAVGRTIPVSAHRFYSFAFVVGFFVSSTTYLVLCWIWPIPLQVSLRKPGWNEPKDYFRPGEIEGPDIESSVTTSQVV